jgi:hypothetical protein
MLHGFYVSWLVKLGSERPRLEKEFQPGENLTDALFRKRPDFFPDEGSIHRRDLGDVDDARPGEIRFGFFQEDVAKDPGAGKIRRQKTPDDGADRAGIVNIILNDNDRMVITGFRTPLRAKVHPKYVTLPNLQDLSL